MDARRGVYRRDGRAWRSAQAHCDLVGHEAGAIGALGLVAQHDLRCVDICELHRGPAGGVLQVDLLFVKPKLFDAFSAQLDLR